MILPDLNLLIHAYNEGSPQHLPAKLWWGNQLNGTRAVALPWIVILGFIRLSTHPKVFASPFSPAEALERIEEWLTLSHVFIPTPSERHFTILKSLLEKVGAAGNLTTDAHLAALAIERGLILHTTDADFTRFPNLKWINPLHT